jgi:hypothetical protein
MGWLDQLLRRAAPGDVPADPMSGSVMSPNYVPETSRRQLGLGALRGVLDLTPVGVADAVQSGINNMQSPLGAAMRAVVGKSALPGDVALGKLGLLGSGPGYDAGRYATNAAAPMTGLLGNQAGGALPKGYARNQSGAIVWHGSPHKFDRFDASKIGTGEGAQAYGHGLYLAESQGVGQQYADVLSSPRNRVMDKAGVYIEPSPMGDGMYRIARQSEIGKMRGQTGDATQGLTDYQFPNLAAAIKAAKKSGYLPRQGKPLLNAIGEDGKYVPVRRAADVTEEAFGHGPEYAQFIASEPGNLYKVDLPDDAIARMLDWDKPLYRQKPEVRKAVRELVDEKTQPGTYAQWVKASRPDMRTLQNDMLDSMDNSAISEALRGKGIPGIRYLDGGSRSAGSGTSNFVVFPGNEGLLNILERNGQPLR